ncbi:hypothetical protein O1611_g7380 [Lasiodiplodia mahajangana]|uniref:Uncharacterized protein n=1 Tax=Lasiodiplodia mahajangana TaxID=1108764 RepID=A0ACC2JFQ8_9PEZI|nr:hypothetical protein O1611_g7380 [Lasiodiplodia mahajangana]
MGSVSRSMRQPQRQVYLGLLACLILLAFLIAFWSSASTDRRNVVQANKYSSSRKIYDPAANDTLGFSNIFVVGLPDRTDKRDALALTSALTGFNVEFIDGVKGESISDKAVPAGVDRHALMETNLGSWRGHMNAIRRHVRVKPWLLIVEEGLESALIMEDDMDWDVRLKTQLKQIAEGARHVMPSNEPSSSPYGAGWDVLWLGQ